MSRYVLAECIPRFTLSFHQYPVCQSERTHIVSVSFATFGRLRGKHGGVARFAEVGARALGNVLADPVQEANLCS